MAKAVKREWSDWLNPVLVKEIRGDYNTVVGLPVAEVYHQLTE